MAAVAVIPGFAQDVAGHKDVAGYKQEVPGSFRITVHRVDCGPAGKPSPAGCRVRYSYRVENRSSVYIEELGEVPAEGEFDYVSKEPRITLLYSPDPEAVIGFINVERTADTRSEAVPKFPSFYDFPQAPPVVGKCLRGTFFSGAQRALQAVFGSRYDPDESRNGVRYLITDYTEIKGPSPNVKVKVAVMISHPEPPGDATGFRIRWIAREKNKLNDNWRDVNSDSKSAPLINKFVDGLRVSIERPKP
jgi:hypothetical protein